MQDLPYQTLHCHTINSDGDLTHDEVLNLFENNRIGVVAFTDHDAPMKVETFERLKKINSKTKFISGIEISCDKVDGFAGKLSTFHVTGLFVDPTNQNLIDFCTHQLSFRRLRGENYVKNLNTLGFKITMEDVLKYAKGDSIGRPSILKALKLYPENIVLIDSMLEDLKQAAKTDPKRKRDLDEIQARQADQNWFQLVLSRDKIYSAEPDDNPAEFVTLTQAVDLIRGAGGLALVAHWSYLSEQFTLDLVEKLLSIKGLDGMETTYSFGQNFNKDKFTQDMHDLIALCDKYSAIQGGGIDFHAAKDLDYFYDAGFSDRLARTPGMLEKILKLHPDLDLTWTSL